MGSELSLPAGYRCTAAEEGDLEGIRRIYNQAVETGTATFDTEPKSLEERRAWLAAHDDSHPVLSVRHESSGDVAAWGSLSRWSEKRAYDSTAEVSIYVDPAHQKRGLGGCLLEQLIEIAHREGLHMLISRIAEGNAASLALHRRFGFRHVGTLREVGCKFGRYIDVDIFELRVGKK
ncbi:N-acetyltransferase family protein [Marispirochaeta aestuarii]|uniref:GNAT family N-acetyltransferase n=1 Tax=Marispirochaeta aestuarii TaxID=1963862 RepID=UPI002ABDAB3E|nr:N-acetyltransferase family protein [Marispirochaeta aestuarii]